jgi:hypothetical protein
MMNRETLVAKTAKELLVIAKDLQIVGRHDMKKDQLVEAILKNEFVQVQNAGAAIVEVAKDKGTYIAKTSEGLVFADNGDDIERRLAAEANSESKWDNIIKFEDVSSRKLQAPQNRSSKESYLRNITIGTLIAFKIKETKMLSGKIEEIHKSDYLVETKNGVRFTVPRANVAWVKTGPRWPKGIYLALRGEVPNGNQAANSRN